jgi:broad specificity phosphatase PhoE
MEVKPTGTRVILVRHGQTEWNRVERFRGRIDLGLNETGRAQARATAARLAGEGLAAIYTSPLTRARETAQPLAAALGLAVIELPGIVDIDYGDWHGLTAEEAAKRDPEAYRLWLTAPYRAHIPGGETLPQVRQRAMAALEEVVGRHQGESIALVSHKVVCQVLMGAVLGLEEARAWDIAQDTCAINIFQARGQGYVVSLLNDTCHLRQPA